MNRYRLLIALLLVAAGAVRAADMRHPLTRALDYDANVLLLLDLNPDNRQLAELGAAAKSASNALGAQQKAAGANAELLAQEHAALAQGTAISDELAAKLEDLRAAEAGSKEKLYTTVDAGLRRLRRSLSREQASLVDWSLPGDIAGPSNDEGLVEEMRTLASGLSQAERFLDRMRYIIPTEYIQVRVARTEEFVRGYRRPGTQEFNEARDWVGKLVDDARLVNEQDWPRESALFSAQLLQHFGALEGPMVDNGQGRAKYNWWDMYYLLTDAQTPQMLSAYAAGGAEAAEDEEEGDADKPANEDRQGNPNAQPQGQEQ